MKSVGRILVILALIFLMIACELPRANPKDPMSTLNENDTTQPELTAVSPADGTEDVEPGVGVSLTFSEAMDRDSVEEAFTLACTDDKTGTFSWSGYDTVVTFTPDELLPIYGLCSLSCATSATDVQGNTLSAAHAGEFRVRGRLGVLDDSFGTDGIVVNNGAAGGYDVDYGFDIAVDAAGRVLVTGYSFNSSDSDMVIWCFDENGALDTSFGTGGFVVDNGAAGGNGSDNGYGITVDAAGRILVTGSSNNGTDLDMVIWRYDKNGNPDTSFGTGGVVVDDSATGGNGNDCGEDITLDTAGRILVTGISDNATNFDMVIWRYDENGNPDTSFGTGGFVVDNGAAGGNGTDWGYGITVDAAGRILVTGYSFNGNDYDMVIWRYDENGNPDTSFGTGGVVVDDSAAGGNGYDSGNGITLDTAGRILVAGFSDNVTDWDMVIWRYDENGSPDTSFGTEGVVVDNGAAGGNDNDYGNGITLDMMGRILVTGFSFNSTDADMALWRYEENGNPDTSFGTGGVVVDDSAAGGDGNDSGEGITLDSAGRILVTGYSSNGTDADMTIWRYE